MTDMKNNDESIPQDIFDLVQEIEEKAGRAVDDIETVEEQTSNAVIAPKELTDEHYIVMSPEGVHINKPEIFEQLEKTSLSASLITSMEKCPAKWLFEKSVKRELIEEPEDTPGKRGQVFHSIMEDFFAIEPPENRTKIELYGITARVIKEQYPEFADNEEVIEWTLNAIHGYYQMGGNPKEVNIATVKKHKSKEFIKGLEVFVKGQLGKASRQTLGYIDQVIQDALEADGVIVSDWKSGAKIDRFEKPQNLDEPRKENRGFPELRQQMIYTMLLEARGANVTSARLVYPVAKGIVNVDVNDLWIRKKVIEDVEKADETLSISIEQNTFEYGPSILCSWCPLVNICPGAQRFDNEKAVNSRAKQPTAEELEKGVFVKGE